MVLKKFAAELRTSNIYLGTIESDTFRGLKMQASKKCNNYFRATDEMTVFRCNGYKLITPIRMWRINNLAPNNTIIRGEWG